MEGTPLRCDLWEDYIVWRTKIYVDDPDNVRDEGMSYDDGGDDD